MQSYDRDLSTCAYFFFDFADREKQTYENLLRSLLVQLTARNSQNSQRAMAILYGWGDNSQQPGIRELLKTAQAVVKNSSSIYFIIDALDEARDKIRLLETLTEIHNWKFPNMHALVTSRQEKEFGETFHTLAITELRISNAAVDEDRKFVLQTLAQDPKFKR
ncbi:hypothetical protein BCR34DRAFT_602620 [Clohesyomyces aquaticus]|uniref:Nephrocystin 3-like N-terminal domain-containing protein n=1 Tax=Clohesyomyces aquaticus TaxID=1231657 RepID=A0A1Y1ZHN5_9PLEO|nr:hypothetical protein BCR34DRAFT_602620 [Clohesyomyces aquaticus]